MFLFLWVLTLLTETPVFIFKYLLNEGNTKKKEYAIFIFVHPAQSNYTVHSIISAVNKMDL